MTRAISIRSAVAVCVGLTAALASAQPVIYVRESASGANNGSTWNDAYTDLQSALAVAVAGDEIWVAAGVYVPSPTGDAAVSFQLANRVGLYGGFAGDETSRGQRDWTANETVLSGDVGRDDAGWNRNTANSGHVVVGSGTRRTAVLDGFTITHGDIGPAGTPAGDPLMFGSGLYNVGGNPTVRNCTLRGNFAKFADGGAIYNQDSNPRITNCRIVQNYVQFGDGGGIANAGTSAPLIEDCLFQLNLCEAPNWADAEGGGIAHWSSAPITITRCVFDANTCRPFFPVGDDLGYGAGLWNFSANITVRDCTFTGNQSNFGGGFMSWGPATLINCLFAENRSYPQRNDPFAELGGEGAAIAASSRQAAIVNLINCTIANNHGKKYAVFATWSSRAVIANTILWGNTATHPDVRGTWREQLGGSFSASYSCIRLIFDPPGPGEDPLDPADLPGVIDTNPRFVSQAGSADLRLSAVSPCIDAADNSVLPGNVATDLDQLPRFADDPNTPDSGRGTAPLVDMGAYELHSLLPGDLNCDGAINAFDIEPFLTALFDPNNYSALYPDCDIHNADINADGSIDAFDIEPFLILLFP